MSSSFQTTASDRAEELPESPAQSQLSWQLRLFRSICVGLLVGLIGRHCWAGIAETKLVMLVAALPGILNPVWGLYMLALFGGLYLVDAGSHYLEAVPDAMILGSLVGELRLLGRPDRDLLELTPGADDPWSRASGQTAIPVNWGAWPVFGVCLIILLTASAIPGIILTFFKESDQGRPDWVTFLTGWSIFGPATIPEWTIQSLLNWTTGLGICAVAARRATPLRVARFLKFGALGLVAICVFGLLDWVGTKIGPPQGFSLHELRAPYPDPVQIGRLQGTARHPGWFGEWIVLFWPGLALWWWGGGTRKKWLVVGCAGMVWLCLILTAARAPWLGAGVMVVVGGLFLYRQRPEFSRLLLATFITIVVLVLLGIVAGGEVLTRRLETLLRFNDRSNYFFSAAIFIREFPMGMGLGTHFHYYDWWFTPYFLHYQPDHVTSHNQWLHLWIENGPFMPLLYTLGVLFTLFEVRRAWPGLTPGARGALVTLWMGLGAIIIVGVAQYFFYIRVVECSFWILTGLSLGLCRGESRQPRAKGSSLMRMGLLLCVGVIAIMTASANARREYIDKIPRWWDRVARPGQIPAQSTWTGRVTRFPVDPQATGVTFSLYRAFADAKVKITWPDGSIETFTMKKDESRPFVKSFRDVPEAGLLTPPRWLVFETSPVIHPQSWDRTAHTDQRALGVYVSDFQIQYPDAVLQHYGRVPTAAGS